MKTQCTLLICNNCSVITTVMLLLLPCRISGAGLVKSKTATTLPSSPTAAVLQVQQGKTI